MSKPVALWDTECFVNFWCLKFLPLGASSAWTFAIRNGQRFDQFALELMCRIFDNYRTISFNGDYYDVPMMRGVFFGYATEELKALNDRIIVEQAKPWELGLGEWKPADHVDIKQVCPGSGSQNMFAARIGYHTIEDFEIDFSRPVTAEQMAVIESKCENDLGKLKALYDALAPQLRQRERIGQKYGVNVMSKSDAQVAEAVLRKRCELSTGRRIFTQKIMEIDWNYRFRYDAPGFISYQTPQLQRALDLVRRSIFIVQPPSGYRDEDDGKGRCIPMPSELEGLEISLGQSVYRMGIGGLHSSEKKLVAVSNATHQLLMPDVASYYPNLMVNAGAFPPALGAQFVPEFEGIKAERLADKELEKRLAKAGDTSSAAYEDAAIGNAGGKIMINGTFGKTGSPFSVLWAPKMLVQTTLTGQLSLLMLIEWHELYGIPVISANTDGLVIYCPRDKLTTSEALIKEWERRTGLTMETERYEALYARDVNNYCAIKTADDVKRKGEYASSRDDSGKPDLTKKKNPDVEICADAAADYLAKRVPVEQTIRACRDITKFVTTQKVAGGGVKMWGEGPHKGQKVADMTQKLATFGWLQAKRGKWEHASLPGRQFSAGDAFAMCFAPRVPEFMGVTCRWYYSTRAPGPILYRTNGNTVGNSYGARPAQVLPEVFPDDIDYDWYVTRALRMLEEVGANMLRS